MGIIPIPLLKTRKRERRMFNFFSNDHVFNITQFSYLEKIIAEHWDKRNDVLKLSQQDFVNKMALYYMHVLEEANEMRVAEQNVDSKHISICDYTNPLNKEVILEEIDIIMYLTAALHLNKIWLEGNFKNKEIANGNVKYPTLLEDHNFNSDFLFVSSNCPFILPMDTLGITTRMLFYASETKGDNIPQSAMKDLFDKVNKELTNPKTREKALLSSEMLILELNSVLQEIRVLFPQRKWHCPQNLDRDTMGLSNIRALEVGYSFISTLIIDLVTRCNFDYDYVNECFKQKILRILSFAINDKITHDQKLIEDTYDIIDDDTKLLTAHDYQDILSKYLQK